jgi:NADPH:quinone reductase-like Zn-dependent oxidoreductase
MRSPLFQQSRCWATERTAKRFYPDHALLGYPENLNPIEAAAVNTGLFTAYFALMEIAQLQRGQFVVVTAASSSTGIPPSSWPRRLVTFRRCFLRGIKLHAGFQIFDFTGNARLGLPIKQQATERAKNFINRGLSSRWFTAKIDRVFYGLDKYVAAHQYLETGVQVGKIVVSLDWADLIVPGGPAG